MKWDHLMSHPSEFIRVDEQLRLKQVSLAKFNEQTDGWTRLAAQENLDHQRMIQNMRCFLHIQGCQLFMTQLFSSAEYNSLKSSFVDRDNFVTENDQAESFNYLSQMEFNLIVSLTADRLQTEKYFKKIMSEVLNLNMVASEKEKVFHVLMTKCKFTLS